MGFRHIVLLYLSDIVRLNVPHLDLQAVGNLRSSLHVLLDFTSDMLRYFTALVATNLLI